MDSLEDGHVDGQLLHPYNNAIKATTAVTMLTYSCSFGTARLQLRSRRSDVRIRTLEVGGYCRCLCINGRPIEETRRQVRDLTDFGYS